MSYNLYDPQRESCEKKKKANLLSAFNNLIILSFQYLTNLVNSLDFKKQQFTL